MNPDDTPCTRTETEAGQAVTAASTAAERWVVSSGTPQWVELETLAPLEQLERRVAELRSEHDRLEAIIAEARAAGRREAADEQAQMIAQYAAAFDALRDRAVSASLRVAEAFVAEHLQADSARAAALFSRALAGQADVQRLRVAVGLGPAAERFCAAQSRTVVVVEDPQLRLGDAVLELPHGQVDRRVNSLLELVRAEVTAELRDDG